MKCECVLYKNARLCHKNAKTQDHYADDDAKPAEIVQAKHNVHESGSTDPSRAPLS